MKLIRMVILSFLAVHLSACSSEKSDLVASPTDYSTYALHGRTLARGLAACGFCHGSDNTPMSPLSGGRTYSDRFGDLIIPNITPSKSGIGEWTTQEVSDFF